MKENFIEFQWYFTNVYIAEAAWEMNIKWSRNSLDKSNWDPVVFWGDVAGQFVNGQPWGVDHSLLGPNNADLARHLAQKNWAVLVEKIKHPAWLDFVESKTELVKGGGGESSVCELRCETTWAGCCITFANCWFLHNFLPLLLNNTSSIPSCLLGPAEMKWKVKLCSKWKIDPRRYNWNSCQNDIYVKLT